MDAVYSYVEKAYTRMQAGDVLIRCLEVGTVRPIQELAEGLILAGPKSLDALREVLAETVQRKSQVKDDLHQVFTELRSVLRSYGIQLEPVESDDHLQRLTPFDLLRLIREEGVNDRTTQDACLNVLHNSHDLIASLSANLHLLADVESYLQDWMYSLAYQSARRGSEEDAPAPPTNQ
ncbi:MAG: hypothetical protein JW726_04215 [Anaerolineales bacterium]|nr:hypothetical protein [Anaerolineales bacterium]